jgi:SAM-dependent methyltransferase
MKSAAVTGPIAFYDREALVLAPRYDSISFEDVHRSILDQFPREMASVLDVGAGSGRDAAALNQRGNRVVAVEPAAALATIGRARAPEAEWIADLIPLLPKVRSRGELFDFVLCSAVLMSLPPEEIAPSFASMGGLLNPEGKLVATIRDSTPAEIGLLHTYSDQDIVTAADAANLRCIKQATASDALSRGHVWRAFIFARH